MHCTVSSGVVAAVVERASMETGHREGARAMENRFDGCLRVRVGG